jgi:hypothetical protein
VITVLHADMISVQYLMSRDGELPAIFQKLNRFGVPWVSAIVATAVPVLVLVVSHDLEHLAALYAIGVVGAVAINISLVSTHPRLRKTWRKVAAATLGVFLLCIWVTLAFTKLHALAFVTIVLIVGLGIRSLTRYLAIRRGPRPSLIRQAIMEQLTPESMSRPKVLVGTYGSEALARSATEYARDHGATLVVCFVRPVNLGYKWEGGRGMSIDTDQAAIKTFGRFLEVGHELGVPVLPVYDVGPEAAELLAENAAIQGADTVLIGTSRQGALYHLIKGHFQRRLEQFLPPDVQVKVLVPASEAPPESQLPASAAGVG